MSCQRLRKLVHVHFTSLLAHCCYLLSTLLRSVVKHFCLKILRERERERKERNKEILHQHPGILLLNKNPEGHNKSQSNRSFSVSSSLHPAAVKWPLQSCCPPGVTTGTDTSIQPKDCRKPQIKLLSCQRCRVKAALGQSFCISRVAATCIYFQSKSRMSEYCVNTERYCCAAVVVSAQGT